MNAQAQKNLRTQEIHKSIVRDLVDRRNGFRKGILGCIASYLNEIGVVGELRLSQPVYIGDVLCRKLRKQGTVLEVIGELDGAEDDDGEPVDMKFFLDNIDIDKMIEIYSAIV